MQKKTLVTWQEISIHLPTRPSVRTLQRKWRKLHLPIRTDSITGKKYVVIEDLIQWIASNPNQI